MAGGAGRVSRHAAPPIVIQGDTEPASVEQSAFSARRAVVYDLRILFQVNVEEGRHLWAMVYLLHKYSAVMPRGGGRPAAPPLRQVEDAPRMLGAFNEATPDWLSFFMFTFFTDRDGKMQPESLAQSGIRSALRCYLLLHADRGSALGAYVGCARLASSICRPSSAKLNLHYSLSLDLFGVGRS